MHELKLILRSMVIGFMIGIVMGLIILLCGCTPSMPKVVDVPVVTKTPKLYVPDMPILPIGSLTDKSSHADIMEAYVISVKLLADDDKLLRRQLLEVQSN